MTTTTRTPVRHQLTPDGLARHLPRLQRGHRMTAPVDAIATCPRCGTWVRTGQSWLPGHIHATCPTNTGPNRQRARLHRREATIKGRKS